ncbi:MAG: response regulator [Blautia sp.]|mgnify:CR=1 FL=1|nr:response regulator [Blautia sp.]
MYRILLVDDEILIREAIKENIDWAGLDCELAGSCQNGQEAAEFVKKNPVDIVLTDICMPYMDGMELSHFLHDNYPDIVIVIFSGFSEFEYAKKAIQYNVSEYLLKPITAMELTKTIEDMKEKVDNRRKEKNKMESLTKASESNRKNSLLIRSKAIDSLVTCTSDLKDTITQLEGMGIHLNAPWYRVAVFDMDLYSDMYQIDMQKRQESALMAFVLFNVSEEILDRHHAGYAYLEGTNRVNIIFIGNQEPECPEQILAICREIQEKVRELMGMEVSIGIGRKVRKLEYLVDSHTQAEDGLALRYLLGGNLLIDMEKNHAETQVNLYDACKMLEDSMLTGKKNSMSSILEKMEKDIQEAHVSKNRACMYMQQIIRSIGRVQENVVTDLNDCLKDQEEYIEKVSAQNTFSRGMRLVCTYAARVFDDLFHVNSTSSQRLALQAIDYIQNNYMDADISLNHICSYLNISTSHFSTLFKEETGETFMEVLIRTRMEKAKGLLETTTLKNYEIAERVGFSDPHYFGISFKKTTGKTPTEYARMFRKT